MSTESNKGIVRRYFEEVVDRSNFDILDEIVTRDCIIHRPETSESIRGLEAFRRTLERILEVYSEFTTTIHDLIAEQDQVACRLSHRAVNRSEWTSRLGTHAVAGKTVSWPAIAIFRFHDGKIAEEWVSRDELGMLFDLGVLERAKNLFRQARKIELIRYRAAAKISNVCRVRSRCNSPFLPHSTPRRAGVTFFLPLHSPS